MKKQLSINVLYLPGLILLLAASVVRSSEIESHTISSEYQSGSQEIRVLRPDDYKEDGSYRVLYVLPVEKGFERKFGYGLEVFREMDAHNRFDLIIVQAGFEKEPWFGDHVKDPKVRQAAYLKECVVPFIEQTCATPRTPEGRLLFGFSKSGWGAFSLIFTWPEFFGYAAAWDSPILFSSFHYGMKNVYGTTEQLARYRPDLLIPEKSEFFQTKKRLVLTGEKLWGTAKPAPNGGSHTMETHALLKNEGVLHHYDNSLRFPHRWDKRWMTPTLEALMDLTEE